MERHFDIQLNKLNEKLTRMGSLVEEMISVSIKGFIEGNKEVKQEIANYETEVNDLQIEIDDRVLRLLALMQPVATDLRFLVMVSKIAAELERIGDLAMNVCQNMQYVEKIISSQKIITELSKMGEIVQKMLKDGLDSFVNRDAELAKKVLGYDDNLDNFKDTTFSQIKEKMAADSPNIQTYVSLMLISRNFERAGDQITNIAEEVIYLVLGRDVRHHREEKQMEENQK